MVIEVLRRFNRSYTQRIGVLDESYLATGRPLGPSRLLFEIEPDGSSVLALRRRLGLDSGYVSRMLRRLEHDGLVTVVPDPEDRRQRVVLLTARGHDEQVTLDRRSEDVAASLVAPLSDRQRTELAAALDTAERLLRAATVEFEVVSPSSPEARRAMGAYFAELDDRFPGGFDADSARDESAEAAAMSKPAGEFMLVSTDGEPIGCGGLQRLDLFDDAPELVVAEVKRMWIDPRWRGLGLARRLLGELERLAADGGAGRVVLDTNESLVEAIAMYRSMGYEPTDRYNDNPYAHHWFTKRLSARGPGA